MRTCVQTADPPRPVHWNCTKANPRKKTKSPSLTTIALASAPDVSSSLSNLPPSKAFNACRNSLRKSVMRIVLTIILIVIIAFLFLWTAEKEFYTVGDRCLLHAGRAVPARRPHLVGRAALSALACACRVGSR